MAFLVTNSQGIRFLEMQPFSDSRNAWRMLYRRPLPFNKGADRRASADVSAEFPENDQPPLDGAPARASTVLWRKERFCAMRLAHIEIPIVFIHDPLLAIAT
ncbi:MULTISPECIES: hypothetical protein [Azotobacter]|uniref:hypothetical protein n=1 Tax=Azotobacter TaxID=352 RepID=UPI00158728CD|nr:hypothetical protein [Azotobacter vinelandii]WKN24638.1 hypothetical protein AVAEIV_000578 [Azotobacter vinelandii]